MRHTAMMRRLAVLVGTALVAVLAASELAWAATALAVSKTVPSSGATEVARTVNVKAYFNHDMKASTITSSTFKIRKQGTTTWLGATRSVNNTISPTSTNGSSQSVATLNPNSDLAANTTYQVMAVGGSSGVKDLNGNALGANKSWTFKTVDTIAPAAPAITSPRENGFVGASFTLSGTAEPDATVEVFEGTTSKVTTKANGSGVWSKALSGLSEGAHTYAAKATDAAGNTSSASNAHTVNVDTTPPTVNSISPANTATGVTPNTDVAAIFSEAMDPSSISDQTFTLKEQGSLSKLGATVSYDPTTKKVTLDPSADLTPNTTYTATLTTGVKDLAGNAMVQEKTWGFKTGTNPVSSVTITPTTMDLSVTTTLALCEKSGTLTWKNYGIDQVDFWDVSITGPDAQYFSTGSQKLLLTYDYLGLPGGFEVGDEVTFKAGQTAVDRSRNYFATLTYKDGNGATIGSPVSLTATARCLSV